MVYTDRGTRLIGERLESIDWVVVEPGSTYIGSSNRAVMFGAPGPRHEVSIQYRYEISDSAIKLSEVVTSVESGEVDISSESEWQLAFDRGLISEGLGIEVLQDRLASSYWGKICDGRPFHQRNSSLMVCREWRGRDAIPRYLPANSEPEHMVRVVRRETREPNPMAPRLPIRPPRTAVMMEEALIILILGIIPSFLWALFNASPGYIETGWPGLVLGGLILGLLSGIIWRPTQPTWWSEGSQMYPRR